MFIETNLRKTKWLLFGCYQPPSQCDNYFFNHIKSDLNILSQNYNKYMLVGDLMQKFRILFIKLHSWNQYKKYSYYTCYKIVKNPSCIDPVITNSPLSSLSRVTITTSLFDFHKITVLKIAFSKLVSQKMIYKDYKIFNRDKFMRELEVKIKL